MSKEQLNIRHEELRGAGSRRVLEALRLVSDEMSDFDDDDLPEVPAGVLMKRRSEGGGMQMR
jgi:hypothetical protein